MPFFRSSAPSVPPARWARFLAAPALAALLLVGAPPASARNPAVDPPRTELAARVAGLLEPLAAAAPTGVLIDRALPLGSAAAFDGRPEPPAADAAAWRQMLDELRRAGAADGGPGPDDLRERARVASARGEIPLGILDFAYDRIREDALEDGSLRIEGGQLARGDASPFVSGRRFAVAALRDRTFRGGSLVFSLPEDAYHGDAAPRRVSIDFADGQGFRDVPFGARVPVRYDREGVRTLQARVEFAGGEVRHARFLFDVQRLLAPAPDDTLAITATVPHLGQFGTGQAFIYRSASNPVLTQPVIVVEGFDLDNTLNWPELYDLLNQQNLIESLRAEGYDAVVLNFTEATNPIQENAYVVAELVQQINAMVGPTTSNVLIGASMGGLCTRYALLWMEDQGIDHRTRTWISFDSPQAGANIPLGIQYWLDFFQGQSTEAAFLLSRLDTPAARQMLLYHHQNPPGGTGVPDPLRTALTAEFTALGNWPTGPRIVAAANGSGNAADQGYAPATQVIDYEYTSFLVDITGNVWALGNGGSTQVLEGLIDIILLPDDVLNVTITGNLPWDNAPGGSRSSMADMDATTAPYGDIIALYDDHCFIPTISSLALTGVTDPFFDVSAQPDPAALSPFEEIYFPAANEEHVEITAASALWFLDQIREGVVAAPVAGAASAAGLALRPAAPNPFRDATRIRFTLGAEAAVTVSLHDVAGRRIERLLDGVELPAGPHEVRWARRDLAPGVYFYRVRAGGERAEGRAIVLD